ncbi:uncharacterized protein [Blastocystis hominis]|uniref:Actin n=1 Tax=Blastocystis hominis TaxID=12968 RepID=D8M1A3_BLAHO|nr:uncharacterized protein [Blastocystis hominis]CBK21842.2 unnamed protein product [Blastocystis hominis]|eukprot:XP_012895890.1 uncharacterized protein [Blastocystis hominis]
MTFYPKLIHIIKIYLIYGTLSFKVKTKDKTMTILRPMFVCDRFIQESQKALFYIFQFKEVRIMPKNYLPVLTTGYSSGLVIDFGYRSISILPVAFGVCDLMNYDDLKYGMEDWKKEEKEEAKEFLISELSLAIVNVLSSLAEDVRIHVFPRLILTGGGVSIPNIKERLEDSVQRVLSKNPSFWRGFVIARLSKICGERLTRDEWNEGKRWKDPIVQ